MANINSALGTCKEYFSGIGHPCTEYCRQNAEPRQERASDHTRKSPYQYISVSIYYVTNTAKAVLFCRIKIALEYSWSDKMRLHPATNGKLRSKSTVKNDSHNTGDMKAHRLWVTCLRCGFKIEEISHSGPMRANLEELLLSTAISSSTVAVWLGLTPDELPTPTEIENMVAQVDCDLTCKLKSPDGEPMTLKRIVDD